MKIAIERTRGETGAVKEQKTVIRDGGKMPIRRTREMVKKRSIFSGVPESITALHFARRSPSRHCPGSLDRRIESAIETRSTESGVRSKRCASAEGFAKVFA